VVKGICERKIAHSSLEREICLVGVKQTELQSLYIRRTWGVSAEVYSVFVIFFQL
jgi:hypothetical protein